ncbi:TPA: hypothetical protein QEM39_003761 [Pseudomonas putida]|uniref:hypothetical protein n=1 Tax=Pseudomonas putida TaxID=303 RepID=UPI00236334F6|nr:hypothetical protein [Pseudomonas putida]MDD2149977.1 hypothetical protein [Pseudomonas putida]HDS1682182.1 hypothetical protein [Pseudomonas putida]
MPRLLLIVALALLPAGASFAKAPDQCEKISDLAAEAMKARQDGELLKDATKSVGDGSKFSEGMVMKAYQVRVFEDSKDRATAISEFQNAAYRECYDAHN